LGEKPQHKQIIRGNNFISKKVIAEIYEATNMRLTSFLPPPQIILSFHLCFLQPLMKSFFLRYCQMSSSIHKSKGK